jgi:hypothetical protein
VGGPSKEQEWYGRVGAAQKAMKARFAARMKQLAEDPIDKRLDLRNESVRRALEVGHSLMPSDFHSRLNFRDHGDLLEIEWPGCSVMWDAHPEIRLWENYCLMVVWNYMSRPPTGSRHTHVTDIAHRKHRRQNLRTVAEASVEGLLMLVAYMLHMPGKKPAQIATESMMEMDPATRFRRGITEVGAMPTTTFMPVRAIYTASETRWTLVR